MVLTPETERLALIMTSEARRDDSVAPSFTYPQVERMVRKALAYAALSTQGMREALFESGYNAAFHQADRVYDLEGAWAIHENCGGHVHAASLKTEEKR